MRKVLVLIGVAVLTLSLFSPAEAARKKSFSISLNPAPSGTATKYNDTSLDLSSSSAPKNTFTTIRGKVKGGKVAGKSVRVYATNMNSQSRKRTSLGTAKISRSGYFTKRFTPRAGHAGTYKIEIVKKAGGGRRTKTKTFYIRVFEFMSLDRFYDAAASTPELITRFNSETRESVAGVRWTESYGLADGARVVYDIRGFRCFYFNLKIGVSDTTEGRGSYRVYQPGRGTIMSDSMKAGETAKEPGKDRGKSIRATEPLLVTVAASEGTRFVLGNPKISCTMPTRIAARAY